VSLDRLRQRTQWIQVEAALQLSAVFQIRNSFFRVKLVFDIAFFATAQFFDPLQQVSGQHRIFHLLIILSSPEKPGEPTRTDFTGEVNVPRTNHD
jgi:hypothetical protein